MGFFFSARGQLLSSKERNCTAFSLLDSTSVPERVLEGNEATRSSPFRRLVVRVFLLFPSEATKFLPHPEQNEILSQAQNQKSSPPKAAISVPRTPLNLSPSSPSESSSLLALLLSPPKRPCPSRIHQLPITGLFPYPSSSSFPSRSSSSSLARQPRVPSSSTTTSRRRRSSLRLLCFPRRRARSRRGTMG